MTQHSGYNAEAASRNGLRYPFAKNSSNELVMIDRAEREIKYNCWGCGQEMIPKKGNVRIHHFCHKPDANVSNCSFESALHNAFKTKLFNRINDSLKHNKEHKDNKIKIYIAWRCLKCGENHQGNLIGKLSYGKMENYIGEFKPDISLFRDDGSASVIIEVMVTHEIDEKALKYYDSRDIKIIEFAPKSEADLNKIDEDILHPVSVNMCLKKETIETAIDKVSLNELPEVPIDESSAISDESAYLALRSNDVSQKRRINCFQYIFFFIHNMIKKVFK